MVDTVDELIEGMRAMRIRQAIMVTALRRIGGVLDVSTRDAYDSAAFDVSLDATDDGFRVSLSDAPVETEKKKR